MSDKYQNAAAWRSADLIKDQSWILRINKSARKKLAENIEKVFEPGRALFDYSMKEFDLGHGINTIRQAAQNAQFGSGLAVVKN